MYAISTRPEKVNRPINKVWTIGLQALEMAIYETFISH